MGRDGEMLGVTQREPCLRERWGEMGRYGEMLGVAQREPCLHARVKRHHQHYQICSVRA